jgi:hypothetical protein
MGYSFYIISKDREISQSDFDTAMGNLSRFNQRGNFGIPPCDVDFKKHYIRVYGTHSISWNCTQGFILNLVMCLLDLDYKPKVITHDLDDWGKKEDWEWLENVKKGEYEEL